MTCEVIDTQEEMPRDDRDKDWNDVATRQGVLRIDGSLQNLGRSKGGFSPAASER